MARSPCRALGVVAWAAFCGAAGFAYGQATPPAPPAAAAGAEREYTPEEQAQLAEADAKGAEIVQLYGEGRYADAIVLAEEVKATWKQVLGEQHPDYPASLNNLAELYREMADYARAEPLYRQVLEILKANLGEQHPNYVTSLSNLGALYSDMGDYARAELLYRQVLEIRKEIFGERHPDYASSLNNLGALYEKMGDYGRAEPLYLQALEIDRVALGERHPDFATDLNNLGGLYRGMRDYARAEPLYRQALEIRKEILGERHPDYASSLNNLAALYYSMGDYARAEPLFGQALEIKRQVFGERHPDYALGLNWQAGLSDKMGDDARAESLYRQALAIVVAQGEETAVVQDEAGQLALGRSVQSYLDSYLSWLLRHEDGAEAAYAAALGWKGATLVRQRAARLAAADRQLAPVIAELQAVVREWSALAAASDPAAKERLDKLTARKEQLEKDLSRGSAAFRAAIADVDVADLQGALPEGAALVDYFAFQRLRIEEVAPTVGIGAELRIIEGEINVAYLVANGAAAADGRLKAGDFITAIAEGDDEFVSVAGWTLEQVVGRIRGEAGRSVRLKVRRATAPSDESNEAIIEITRAPVPSQSRTVIQLERSLLAFVVRPDGKAAIFDLGAFDPIHAAIDAWRTSYGASAEARQAGAVLREKLWAPLEAEIGDATLVLVSPDGALGKLPFGALPGKAPGSYLIEDVAIALVPVPRLIPSLAAGGVDGAVDRELLVVGGVDYDRREGVGEVPAMVEGELLAVASSRGAARQTAEGLRWSALPGTVGETAAIGKLFEAEAGGVAVLEGAAATEEAFRELAQTSRILHVATHGFFAPEGRRSALDVEKPEEGAPLSGGGFQVSATADLGSEKPGDVGFAPGLLSGIVLAGANDPPTLPDDPAAFADLPEDGILTAEELAFLPLGGVELAVLSACETGLGQVAGGEGLLGIQRAFQISGVRTTVASLWKVDDAMTQRLMTAFYRNVLEGKQSYLDALRNAQLEILRELRDRPDDVAAELRAAAEAAEARGERGADPPDAAEIAHGAPYFWAAFTLSGDWR